MRLVEVNCNLCGSARFRVVYETRLPAVADAAGLSAALRCTNAQYRSFGRIVECLDCGLVYRNPQEEDTEAGYAAVVDDDYLKHEDARQTTYQKTLALMARETGAAGRLLDVGCYTGTFLDQARAAGWQVEGLEPSEWASRIARERCHLRVITGTVQAADWPGGSFEAITLWDVLEHLRDPRGDLTRLHEWLMPGGSLWLTTMDVASAFPRLLGRRWPHYMRMHLWYFTRDTLARMLREAGFEPVGMWPHVRVLRLSYLAGRLQCYGNVVSAAATTLVRLLHASEARVAVSLGDLVTVRARRSD